MSSKAKGGLSAASFRWKSDNRNDEADADSDRRQLIPKVEDVEDPASEDPAKRGALSRSSRGMPCAPLDYNTLFFLCERQTWHSTDRLVAVFGRIQRVDVLVAAFTLALNLSAFAALPTEERPFPRAAVALVLVMNLCCPFAAIYASKALRSRALLLVTACSSAIKLGFFSISLAICFTADVSPPQGFLSMQVALAVVNYTIGLLTAATGGALYSAIVRMRRSEKSVAFIGLDSAGKSLLLSHLLPKPTWVTCQYILPTAGVELKELKKWDTLWKIWDLSGHKRNRWLWNYYLGHVSAIVFVVDTSDLERLATAKTELGKVLQHQEVRQNLPSVVILANKSDLAETETEERISTTQLEQVLDVTGFHPDIRCKYFSTCGISGAGIEDAMQWILEHEN